MLLSFALRISMDCSACRVSIPINGIVAFAACYHCGEDNTVNPRLWEKRFLDSDVFERAECADRGLAELNRFLVDTASAYQLADLNLLSKDVRIEFGCDDPRCPKCGDSVLAAALRPEAQSTGAICPRCGTNLRVRQADSLALYVHPGARLTVGEQASHDVSLHAKAHPVLFQCMSCGSSLPLDGSTRIVTCTYCRGDNFLPDSLWHRLRPVPKPEVFYLLCEVDSIEDRRERASRADLPPGEFRTLAGDKSQRVCAAVAANPRAPRDVLKQLSLNPHRSVLEALASNPSLPPELIEAMARSDDAEFRSLAASHPALSHDTLRKLLHDPRLGVQQAAAARVEQLRMQGVELKGFFARLFGH